MTRLSPYRSTLIGILFALALFWLRGRIETAGDRVEVLAELQQLTHNLKQTPSDIRSLQRIIALAKGPRQFSAVSAIESLDELGDIAYPAVDELIYATESNDIFKIHAAAKSLGSIRSASDRTVPVLRRLLYIHNGSFAPIAAESLGRLGIGAKEAVADLIDVAHRDDDRTFEAARLAIEQISGTNECNESLRIRHIADAFVDHGRDLPNLEIIADDLINPSQFIARCAASELFIAGPDGAYILPQLIDAVNSNDPVVARYAVVAIRQTGPAARDKATPHLVLLLKREGENIAYYSAMALGAIGAVEAIPALQTYSNSSDFSLARECRDSLKMLLRTRADSNGTQVNSDKD